MDDEVTRSGEDKNLGQLQLLLLRHGEVGSHNGDVPVTAAGLEYATTVGRFLGSEFPRIQILDGETLRTRQTAEAISAGARANGASVHGSRTAHSMRNPDLYVAGVRVNMVSTPAALAAQVDGFTPERAAAVPFFNGFFSAPDRIRFWLDHDKPCGETRAMVAERICCFAQSLVDLNDPGTLTVAVTHSPVLRACAIEFVGEDPGEPDWVAGLAVTVNSARSTSWRLQEALVDDGIDEHGSPDQ